MLLLLEGFYELIQRILRTRLRKEEKLLSINQRMDTLVSFLLRFYDSLKYIFFR